MSSVQGTWSDAEVQILRDMWPTARIPAIAAHLNRSQFSVRDKIKHLGMHKDRIPVSIRPVDMKDTADALPPVRSCQFPHGEPGDLDFHFCGDVTVSGGPYCAYHRSICYVQKADAA